MHGFTRPAILVLATLLVNCTSSLDKVVCDRYDDVPEHVQAPVLNGIELPPGAEVIECLSAEGETGYYTGGGGDDEACLVRLMPADFEATFPAQRYGPQRPRQERAPVIGTPYVLAEKSGIRLTWLRAAERDPVSGVFYNDARDHAVVLRFRSRCGAPSEVI